jgi:hypothetical protein|tara:strand:+ start:637 stop:876 length:240 start_codon:yes stop_codon:yes gene_type:complete
MPGVYGTHIKVYKMFQIITKIDNLVQARDFKTKKDAENYLYSNYLDDCFSRDSFLDLNDYRFQYEIIKINDSIPISKQV